MMQNIEVRNNNLDWMVPFLGTVIQKPKEQKLLMVPVDLDEDILPRFTPIMPTDGHFFDISRRSDSVIPDTVKVFIEESATGDSKKRVTSSDPVLTRNGVPDIEFSEYNIHAEAEFEATQRQFLLAKKGYNLIFWISAEDGARGLTSEQAKEKGLVYSDGRFNIMFAEKVGREVSMKGKHLPLDIDRFRSLELGRKLKEMGGKTLGKVETVEDLRVQPIGFKLENLDNWISECRKMMPEFEDFWQVFENGDDVKHEALIKKDVEKAMGFANGNNLIFQLEMEKMGHRINTSGLHGIDYLGNRVKGVHNFDIKIINGQYYTEPVYDNQGQLVCPICGEKVTKGDVFCPKCGVGLR